MVRKECCAVMCCAVQSCIPVSPVNIAPPCRVAVAVFVSHTIGHRLLTQDNDYVATAVLKSALGPREMDWVCHCVGPIRVLVPSVCVSVRTHNAVLSFSKVITLMTRYKPSWNLRERTEDTGISVFIFWNTQCKPPHTEKERYSRTPHAT